MPTMNELHPIEKAIAAHAWWKSHLRHVIDSGEWDQTVDDVHADDLCEFGRWLRERPVAEKTSKHFRAVSEWHARFHEEATHVLELALAKRADEAIASMAIGSSFASVSARLTSAMVAWKLAPERRAN
jgi:methyl-accepting chemotaxis protein